MTSKTKTATQILTKLLEGIKFLCKIHSDHLFLLQIYFIVTENYQVSQRNRTHLTPCCLERKPRAGLASMDLGELELSLATTMRRRRTRIRRRTLRRWRLHWWKVLQRRVPNFGGAGGGQEQPHDRGRPRGGEQLFTVQDIVVTTRIQPISTSTVHLSRLSTFGHSELGLYQTYTSAHLFYTLVIELVQQENILTVKLARLCKRQFKCADDLMHHIM